MCCAAAARPAARQALTCLPPPTPGGAPWRAEHLVKDPLDAPRLMQRLLSLFLPLVLGVRVVVVVGTVRAGLIVPRVIVVAVYNVAPRDTPGAAGCAPDSVAGPNALPLGLALALGL